MSDFGSVGMKVKTFGDHTVAEAPGSGQTGGETPRNLGEMMEQAASEQAQYTRPQAVIPAPAEPGSGKMGATVHAELDAVNSSSPFMSVIMEKADLPQFTREYDTSLDMQKCVANRDMFLKWMVETERSFNVTLSFHAYGVDPVVFDEECAAQLAQVKAEAGDDKEGQEAITGVEPAVVRIESKSGDETVMRAYEKILVDDVLYFSCVMECLDPDYMHSIIREATEEIYTHNQYMYTLVGPRPLVAADGKSIGMIETLKLNTFEMNLLVQYMTGIEGVTCTHGVFDGRQAILFKR